jgi:hypothetical protein
MSPLLGCAIVVGKWTTSGGDHASAPDRGCTARGITAWQRIVSGGECACLIVATLAGCAFSVVWVWLSIPAGNGTCRHPLGVWTRDLGSDGVLVVVGGSLAAVISVDTTAGGSRTRPLGDVSLAELEKWWLLPAAHSARHIAVQPSDPSAETALLRESRP